MINNLKIKIKLKWARTNILLSIFEFEFLPFNSNYLHRQSIVISKE